MRISDVFIKTKVKIETIQHDEWRGKKDAYGNIETKYTKMTPETWSTMIREIQLSLIDTFYGLHIICF